VPNSNRAAASPPKADTIVALSTQPDAGAIEEWEAKVSDNRTRYPSSLGGNPMTLRLNGSTSGFTEIDAPAVAGSNTLTLPGGNGTNGQVLTTDGAGALSFTTVAGAGSLADGSAAAPSVAFASDVNTGIFRAGNDLLAFSTGGTQRAAIRCQWAGLGLALRVL
jgi:hypothetical protein